MQSWRRENEDWEIRFYDDAACLSFVQREFPEYLEAYKALPKDVERSDFFRSAHFRAYSAANMHVGIACRHMHYAPTWLGPGKALHENLSEPCWPASVSSAAPVTVTGHEASTCLSTCLVQGFALALSAVIAHARGWRAGTWWCCVLEACTPMWTRNAGSP